MENILEKIKLSKNRQNTKNNYIKIWRLFNKFIIKLDKKPDSWEERTILFVAYLIDTGHQSATVKSYVSAIKGVLVDDGYQWLDNKILLPTLTKACSAKNDIVTTRLPIQCGLLEMIVFESQRILYKQPYLATLYATILIISYYGLFRVGEATEGDHVIKASNVHMGVNKDKILIVLYSSKTHHKGNRPQKVKICANPDAKVSSSKKNRFFCPFKLMREYLEVRGKYYKENEQFFIFKDRSPVKPEHIRNILNTCLEKLGLDTSNYGFHSIRIGRASDMENFGYSLLEIKRAGRWRSNIVYKYMRN